MAALLTKDYYTLTRQAKMFLLIIAVFAFIPGFALATMAVVYAAMLPMTALAYDERAKWDSLAAMMPYSARDLVMCKYVIGYIAVVLVSVVTVAVQTVMAAVKSTAIEPGMLASVLMSAGFSLILLAVNLPIMFRFGVEKGRIAFLVIFGALGAVIAVTSDQLDVLIAGAAESLGLGALVIFAAAVAVNVISIAISVAWYKRNAR